MKKISKLLMLSGVVVPTIAIASTTTSCSSKPMPDPTNYVGNADFSNWIGREEGTLKLNFSAYEPWTATLTRDSADTSFRSTNLIIPNKVKDGTNNKEYTLIAIANQTFANSTEATTNFSINSVKGSLAIPNNLTSIGAYAFRGCTRLTGVTFGNAVQTIGNAAFYNCINLNKVTFWNSVTEIGNYAFYRCIGLTGVTFANAAQTIGDHTFDSCISLTGVTFGNGVQTIGESAFKNCTGLKEVTFGNAVQTITEMAFWNCIGLTKVTFGNAVQTIGLGAFMYCSGLTRVTIGNAVQTINQGAFDNCTSLEEVTFANSVRHIGKVAFSDCTSLATIIGNFSTAPDIGDEVFLAVAKAGTVRNNKEGYTSGALLQLLKSRGIPDTNDWKVAE